MTLVVSPFFSGIIRGGIMMNLTMFDPVALENWYADDENSLLLQTEPGKYFQN